MTTPRQLPLLLILALVACAPGALAQPAPTPAAAADNGPAEWTDADTGHRVIRLSSEPGSSTLYFHDNSYSPEGDKYIFNSPSGIMMVDLTKLGSAPIKAEVAVAGGSGSYMARRTREVYFQLGGRGGGGRRGGQRGANGQPPTANGAQTPPPAGDQAAGGRGAPGTPGAPGARGGGGGFGGGPVYAVNYDTKPTRLDPNATLIEEVRAVEEVEALAGASTSGVGSGGMASKLAAARMATWSGIETIIAPAKSEFPVAGALNGVEGHGTTLVARADRLAARKSWIAFAIASHGQITVNQGAMQALENHGRSLLRVGATGFTGTFVEGDAVDILGPEGHLIAKGLTKVSSEHFSDSDDVIVHRDDLVLLRKP
jgi:hypothetical protein